MQHRHLVAGGPETEAGPDLRAHPGFFGTVAQGILRPDPDGALPAGPHPIHWLRACSSCSTAVPSGAGIHADLARPARIGDPSRPARLGRICKHYEPAPALAARDSVVTHEQYHGSAAVPRTKGVRPTTRVVDPPQLHDDMPVTDVAFVSGGPMPFEETHVMQHALCAVEAKAAYKGNRDRTQGRRATSYGCAPSGRRLATPANPAPSANVSPRT
ncbi:hypothetical protein [Pararhodobacter marinus]|uniref:hypothetical protein n=1 Tax=Pararhodobacter marinus TaxID=2184063 RepID=UPI003514E24D